MLTCYHGKVNARVNIHAACECCHVTVIKRKVRRNARCARQTGKASCKIPVNGHRRPYKRTQGARRINTRTKEKARSGHSTGFIGLFNTLLASVRPLLHSTEWKHLQCPHWYNKNGEALDKAQMLQKAARVILYHHNRGSWYPRKNHSPAIPR